MSQLTGGAKLQKELYNSVKNIFAPDPPSGQPARQCIVLREGFSIDAEAYKGDSGEAKQASLFDQIPKIATTWEASGSAVSILWNTLVTTGKAPSGPPPTAAETAAFQEALKKLYVDGEKGYEKNEKSDFYKSLDSAQSDVNKKYFDLAALKMQIQANLPKGATQADYDSFYKQMAPMYEEAIATARLELSNRQRAVQKYETAIFSYHTHSLESLLVMFNQRMEYYKIASSTEYAVKAFPSDWATYFGKDYEVDDSWTDVKISQGYSTTSSSDDSYTKYGGGGFLFTYSTKDSKEVKSTMDHDQDLSVSFKVKTVDLVRPWMDMSLLNYETITLAGARKAQWSNGELVRSNTGSFTLLPTSVILAANVTISASSFSSESMEVIETSTSSPGGLLKLFWFSNNTSHSVDKSSSWNKDTLTMTIEGVQIFGYSCALVPLFPHMNAPN